MNICKFIIEHNIHHIKLEDGRIQQNGYLDLTNNQISSLDGFVQNGYLDLTNNQISSLDGFVQNDYLDLTNNQIENSSITFTNPKTNRFVFKMNEDWFGCGCFIGNKQQLKETCLEQGFLEIIEYFNL